ncbi:MEMO1 family protein [Thermoplasma sp.]|uniref:MEMO1 family protein n=1 Tax=Thermoplasma sp. TaxID=1973142 RepID=UPI00128260F2|nr:MEMO1 family protein [Thermoplasma sp.]KAA8922115.1 MAG: MEMO1 family protein [Thermoplasma sp.]
MKREPAVAGYFYPERKDELYSLLSSFAVPEEHISGSVIGAIVPHAGIIYSGRTAMYSYRAIEKSIIRDFIIIGPNHRPITPYASLYPEGKWSTPLGDAIINERMAEELYRNSDYIVKDEESHRMEHSVEVQIPFLQYMFGEAFRFVPVILGDQEMEIARNIGEALLRISDPFIFIASSDFTHYESAKTVEKKDMDLISAIKTLDLDKFYSVLEEENVTACGYGAIASLMYYTRKRGGQMIFLNHSNSGDVTGDYSEVVGYGSLVSVVP